LIVRLDKSMIRSQCRAIRNPATGRIEGTPLPKALIRAALILCLCAVLPAPAAATAATNVAQFTLDKRSRSWSFPTTARRS